MIVGNAGFVQETSVTASHAKKSTGDPGREVFLHFLDDVFLARFIDVFQQRFADRLGVLVEAVAKIDLQEVFQREIDENGKQDQQARKQARIPCRDSKSNRPDVHESSSSLITYPTPRTVRSSF